MTSNQEMQIANICKQMFNLTNNNQKIQISSVKTICMICHTGRDFKYC